MRKPSIHLNGTSKQELLDQYTESAGAVWQAIKTLADNCPNARDYYVQSNDAIKQAIEEHINRLKRLESVHKELMELADYVCEQESGRQ